jgi:hypothetical protein
LEIKNKGRQEEKEDFPENFTYFEQIRIGEITLSSEI